MKAGQETSQRAPIKRKITNSATEYVLRELGIKRFLRTKIKLVSHKKKIIINQNHLTRRVRDRKNKRN